MEATAIDWKNDLIVSGSIDRSVFVWKYNESLKRFDPEFVNMDEKLSILDLKWANSAKKFVAGTSSKCLYVVHEFEDVNVKDVHWNAKLIKAKFESSILCCSFDPSSRVIAAASFDGSCKVISAIIPGIDSEVGDGPFGKINDFGTPILEFSCYFWLNHVSWSPSGNELCYLSHDATLNFVKINQEDCTIKG